MPHIEVYSFTKSPAGLIYPLVPIIVTHPTNPTLTWSEMALLDTGADHSLFPKRIADAMGYDLKIGTNANSKGVSKMPVETWTHPFRIFLVCNQRKNILWKSKKIEIACVEHDTNPPLLGCSSFLCNFKFTFNYLTKKILIEIP